VSIVLILITTWLLLNRQYVVDQINVWNYTPSEEIKQIESRTGFTDKGIFYLYASKPQVDGPADFNLNCGKREEKSAILGCYTNRSIYVYNINNDQLDGIEEVTTAHEMLHAAWDRMSESDIKAVSTLLEAQYASMNDPKLKERMDYYARTEPGERHNELHSIIGTEVVSISPELEKYYAQYFEDRSKVTTLYESYNAVFTRLADESDALYARLGVLSTEIDSLKESYQVDATRLSNDIATFNQKADGGGFTSNSEFNRQRALLVTRSNALEEQRSDINTKVQQYNDDHAKYQALVIQSQELNKSIDSTLAPAPSL
jgi:predicted metal-dependent hydrolase